MSKLYWKSAGCKIDKKFFKINFHQVQFSMKTFKREVLQNECSLKRSQNWHKSNRTGVSLFVKMQQLKRASGTSAFLQILQNSKQHLCYRAPHDVCFEIFSFCVFYWFFSQSIGIINFPTDFYFELLQTVSWNCYIFAHGKEVISHSSNFY